MNILAIDTITPVLSITAIGPAGLANFSFHAGTQHAEKLIGLIERALLQAGFTAKETGMVVCAEGPGSFTGLRLAYSAAKAIQLASGCPLMPVSPLPCYASGHTNWPGVVISAMDAKKQRFYVQIFRRGIQVTEAMDIEAEKVVNYIDAAEKILVTGPDAALFAETLSQGIPNLDLYVFPSGENGISGKMAEVAQKNEALYTDTVPDHAGPVYVRQSDAETSKVQ